MNQTFKELLQQKLTIAEAEVAMALTTYKTAATKLTSIKEDIDHFESNFSSIIEKDIEEVKNLFSRAFSHFSSNTPETKQNTNIPQ